MGDVKRMKILGSDHIEREYVPAEDYDDLLSLHRVSEAGWKRIEEADDKLKAVCDALRTRLAEVERERDGVAEKLAELLDAFHDRKAGAPEMLLHSDKGQRVTTAYTKAIMALAVLPTQEPTEDG